MARPDLPPKGLGLSSQKTPSKSRAPALALSTEHLNAARSITISGAGSRSSGYLTPPVSGARSMSPPPRVEEDDYLNVHSHRKDKRKHPAPLVKSGKQMKAQATFEARQPDAGVNTGQPQDQSSIERPIHEIEDTHSPAMLALRRLTIQPDRIENAKPWGLRRVSTALSNNFDFLKSRTSSMWSSHQVSKDSEEDGRTRGLDRNEESNQQGEHRRPTFREDTGLSSFLRAPATITLRKASNVYVPSPVSSSMAASIVNEELRKTTSEAPESELLAFYSAPTFAMRSVNPVKALPSEGDNDLSYDTTAEGSSDLGLSSTQGVRRNSVFISKINNTPNVRRSSNPADPALTFADVYVAPGSFTVKPNSNSNSRKSPLILGEALRRISVVHFKSRNSIHEIIWREDETTSGSSLSSGSRTSGSPPRRGDMYLSSTPSPEDQLDPSQREEDGTKAQYRYISPSTTESSPRSKSQDRLFQWSWKSLSPKKKTTQTAAQAPVEAFGLEHGKSSSDPGVADLRTFPEFQPSGPKRSSTTDISEVTDIQSFPPLRSRSSTLEWRKAPLVDMFDPLTGRMQPLEDNTYFAGCESCSTAPIPSSSVVLADGQVREHTRVRKLSSHPYAPPISGPSGRMGSSVGSSSHVRLAQRTLF